MRPLLTAAIVSVGTELTTGVTRDTNSGDVARSLAQAGVVVRRLAALPDDQPALQRVLGEALEEVDLVVTTGGLGPTPDDLTREAIAAVVGETVAVDPEIERWLGELFARRGLPLVEANRKQAWTLPSVTTIPNDNGTAPGWWLDGPDGRVLIALPGPPRELHPMWDGWVRPRLEARGLGRAAAMVTLRTTGLGESLIADRLGELLDRSADPIVATYARADGVDVTITSHDREGWAAAARVAETAAEVDRRLEGHVWGRGPTTWASELAAALDERGWRLAIAEVGTRGALTALLGEGLGERLALAEALAERPAPHGRHAADPEALAARVRDLAGVEAALAMEIRARRGDTVVSIALEDPRGRHRERRVVFLGDDIGRGRAALAAAAVLLARLREPGGDGSGDA
ncbi:MAG TPA: molybdopterin-binding protein [Candidatus Limnocylindrales bacterium]|nr:molybdopterin-binding protein [Candidatus Limnocylindrales bacterium]